MRPLKKRSTALFIMTADIRIMLTGLLIAIIKRI